jgi:hypothetical protein
VSLENSDKGDSKIVFLNVADPAHPERFEIEIIRPHAKCGAVDVTRVRDGRFLVAAWSDSDKGRVSHLDLYLTKGQSLFSGFDQCGRHTEDCVREFKKYQTINFAWSADGQLFLVGFHDDAWPASPGPFGKSWAELYSVDLSNAFSGKPSHIANPRLRRLSTVRCECPDRQCNMDAASGLYVAADGRLAIYSAYHFRLVQPDDTRPSQCESVIRFCEFRPAPYLNRPLIQKQSEAWVDLFEDREFEGRRLSMLGPTFRRYPDLGGLSVQSHRPGFDEKVSSVRYQIPPGTGVVLYDKKRNQLSLKSDGRAHEEPNLKYRNFDDRVHSIEVR